MLPPFPPASALADSALEFLSQFSAKVHVFGEHKGNPKHPLARGGYSTATSDPVEIERRCANPAATGYCVYAGDGLMVIDLDVGDGKDGLKELAMLAAEHGEKLPQTAYVTSPRGNGSRHLYLRVSGDVVIPSSNGKIAPGIDVRGNDGAHWIAGPGSRTAKGEYKWERGPEHIIDAPEWLIEAAIAARPRVRESGKPKTLPQCVTWDYPANIERFTAWLKNKAKPSIEGQGGNGTLAATGAMGSSYALYEETTIQLMAEHWNKRCEPPWDDDDLEYHGGSGYRSAEHAGNVATPDHRTLFKQHLATENGELVDDATSELPKGVTRAFYYLGMLDTIPEPTWAIDGILPESGYSLIYGKRSTKKSFLALDMGLSLATGRPFHGRDVKRGRVVYFAGEGFRGNRRRIKVWFKARKLKPEDYAQDFALVPFTSKWDTSRGCDLVRRVLSDIAKDGPISLVIIDTARRAMSGDENAPTSVGQFLDGVSGICREFGCGHLIVHHAGKDESKGARGGGPFEDDADAVFHVTKGTGRAVRFKCTKQKDDEDDWAMTFRSDVITLGSEQNGRPITSLALALESESKAEDDDGGDPPSDRERYAAHDAIAIQILEGLQDPSATRAKLATAVMGEMAPEMREVDPNAFKKTLHAYRMHLTRLSQGHALWPFIDQKNDKGEALTFRNPKNRGRRAAQPSRHRTLNYIPFSQEGDN